MDKAKRKAIIAGNWKMNKTPKEATALLNEITPLVKDADCEVIACVPYVDLAAAIEATAGTNVKIGAENCHWAASGAFTGEISTGMLKEIGVEYVVLGHSERRQYFGETDETVNKRTKAALAAGLKPIVCVGELLWERECDITEEVIARQIKLDLWDVSEEELKNVVIAYEPVWAIGTGKTATADQAEEVCAFIRAQLAKLYRDIDDKTANTDHAIVHINSSMLGKKDEEKSLLATVGHEFQHLINFSSSLAGGYDLNMMSTWLNESMSGYVEEQLYSGIQKKDCRYLMYEYSDKVRDGQSLYNFETSAKDAGVYGSVFLFSEYFNKQAGENKIFKKIHDAWRSRKTVTFDTAEAIYKSVPDSYRKTVDSLVSYPSKLKFATKEQEWMSKMALDFYLSLMKFEKTDPKVYENVHVEKLLYDQINAAEIEGGGRIVFATKDGKFSIPSDADSNLVYVGFDKNFNRVTDIICK